MPAVTVASTASSTATSTPTSPALQLQNQHSESNAILSFIYTGLSSTSGKTTTGKTSTGQTTPLFLTILYIGLSVVLIAIPLFALVVRHHRQYATSRSTRLQSLTTRLLLSDLAASSAYPFITFLSPSTHPFLFPLLHLTRLVFLYHSLCLASLLLMSLMRQDAGWTCGYGWRFWSVAVAVPLLRGMQVVVGWIWVGGDVLMYDKPDLVYQSVFVFGVDVFIVGGMAVFCCLLVRAYWTTCGRWRRAMTRPCDTRRSLEIHAVWTWTLSISSSLLPLLVANICLFSVNDMLDLSQVLVAPHGQQANAILWATVYTHWIGVLPNACMGLCVWIVGEEGGRVYRQSLQTWDQEKKERMVLDLQEYHHQQIKKKIMQSCAADLTAEEKLEDQDYDDELFLLRFASHHHKFQSGEDTIPPPMLLMSDDLDLDGQSSNSNNSNNNNNNLMQSRRTAERPSSYATSGLSSGKRTAANTSLSSFCFEGRRGDASLLSLDSHSFPTSTPSISVSRPTTTSSSIPIPINNARRIIVAIDSRTSSGSSRVLGFAMSNHAHMHEHPLDYDSSVSIEWPRLDFDM